MNKNNKKRIAKNTLLLYIRMMIVMCIGLYTSRVVLNTLGVADYGIYQVVGGFVAMLAYLNAVFVSSTQRFLSFTLGTGEHDRLKMVFSTSVIVHFFLALIILVIAESIGLWFINNKLIIDPCRMDAANWIYQCSVFSLMVTILTVPYNASIISHEHMNIFAWVGIFDAIMKLLIVYFLLIIPADKLIVYSVLMLMIPLSIFIFYFFYCRTHFEECSGKKVFNRNIFKEMFNYCKWILIGNLGFTFKDHLSNIIMNGFLGTTINAARGISNTVIYLVNSFAQNFIMALNPQITKQYAAGNIKESMKLVNAGSRYSFYLMTLISIPVILNIDYLLKLWLENPPHYSDKFVIISLLVSTLYVLTNTITTAINATGNIRFFQIGVSLIMLFELPFCYVSLRLGYPPHYAMIPGIFTTVIAIFFRIVILNRQIPEYSIVDYLLKVVLRCVSVFVLCYYVCYVSFGEFENTLIGVIVSSCCCVLSSIIIILFLGIPNSERKMIFAYANKKIRKQ